MTYEPLPGAPNAPQLNLSSFTIPDGSLIKCNVTATGVDVNGNPLTIPIETLPVEVMATANPLPTIDSLILSDLVVGNPVTATATISYEDTNGDGSVTLQDLIDDGWSVEWDWSSTQQGTVYTHEVTLEKTENVFDFNGPTSGGDRTPTTYVPKTVTWKIGSNSPIQHGTFLDGSPWVVDNGDIHLLNTTPESQDKMYGAVINNGDGTYSFDTTNAFTREYRIHNTVINPDFGIKRLPLGDFVRSSASPHYPPNEPVPSGGTNPFDGRAGVNYWSSFITKPENVGRWYDDAQAWDRSDSLLEAGDMVFVYRSMNVPMIDEGNLISVEPYNDGTLYYWGLYAHPTSADDFPQVEQICILNVLQTAPPANAFRPPANWDPADKNNKPIFTEQDTLDTALWEYPTKQVYSDDPPTSYNITDPNDNSFSYLSSAGLPRDYPTDSGVFVTFHTTANQMRQYFPSSQNTRGYGGFEAIIDQYQFIQALDPKLDAEYRTKIRRKMTQKGIDAYGMWRSTCLWNAYSGFHGGHYTPTLIWAWLVTGRSPEIAAILNGENFGSEVSGNYFDSNNPQFNLRWPTAFFHEANQRWSNESDHIASNIDYVFENARVTLMPGTEEIFTNTTSQTITISYDQIIEVDRIPSISDQLSSGLPTSPTLQIKNLNTFRNFSGNFPGWGTHRNGYQFIPSGLSGSLVKGINGIGRVIASAAVEPDGNVFLTKNYDPPSQVADKVRLYIKGEPCIQDTEEVSMFLYSNEEIAENKKWMTTTTGTVKSTHACGGYDKDYHYSTLTYSHFIGLVGNYVGVDNLPYIARLMYDHSSFYMTNPYGVSSNRNQPGYYPPLTSPQDEYWDTTNSVTPQNDNLFSNLLRQLFSPDQPLQPPVIVGKKESWPDDFSSYTFVDRSWTTNPNDFYAFFKPNYNNNNPADFYDLNGNLLWPRTGWVTMRDTMPNNGQTEPTITSNATPFVYEGVEVFQWFEFKNTGGSNPRIPWSNLQGKFLYSWTVGEHRPARWRIVNDGSVPTDPNDAGGWRVRWVRVDENDVVQPYWRNLNNKIHTHTETKFFLLNNDVDEPDVIPV